MSISRYWKDRKIEIVILIYILTFLLLGFSMQSFNELIDGLTKIFTTPSVLITDFAEVGGLGPTFVNAGLVALIGYILLVANKVEFRGLSITAIFSLLGFSLMGKTVWSVLPIMLGVYIYSKLTKREFVTNIYPALFGTALSPIVTQVTFGFGWGFLGGTVVGILIGLVIAPVSNHTLTFHEGYNLYNFGFAAGLIGLFIMNIFRAYGFDIDLPTVWGTAYNTYLRNFSIILFLSMIIVGMLISRKNLKNYLKILKEPGITVTDYVDVAGFGSTLINMGLVGLVGVVFILLVDGDFNGPTVNGLLGMAGFAAFGKHPLNTAPIMVGVWLASLFSVYDTNAPGTVLAGLFGTTLAPLAGHFGPLVGILAGMAHLYIVSIIGFAHGGIDLYNNGFSGGFVASFFIAIVKGIKDEY